MWFGKVYWEIHVVLYVHLERTIKNLTVGNITVVMKLSIVLKIDLVFFKNGLAFTTQPMWIFLFIIRPISHTGRDNLTIISGKFFPCFVYIAMNQSYLMKEIDIIIYVQKIILFYLTNDTSANKETTNIPAVTITWFTWFDVLGCKLSCDSPKVMTLESEISDNSSLELTTVSTTKSSIFLWVL